MIFLIKNNAQKKTFLDNSRWQQAVDMKKILFISLHVSTPSDFRAPRNFSLMRSLVAQGYKVQIVTSTSDHLATAPQFKGSYHTEFIEGVEVTWVRCLNYKKTYSIRRVLSWLDFELKTLLLRKSALIDADYVIASSLSILSIISGYIYSRRLAAKFVFEVRDIWPLTLVDEGGFSQNNPIIRLLGYLEKFGYKKADLIIGTMPNLQEHVKNVAPQVSSDVICIPMGYSNWHLERQTNLRQDYENEYLPEDKFIVTHLGSIGLSNALETLIKCADQLCEYSNIHFLVVGQGDSLSKLKATTSNLKNITFAPHIPKEEVQSLLKKSDLLFFSSSKTEIWKYGQSLNKLVDYMLSGRPIIGSYSGYASMVNEAGCGEFVEAENPSILAKKILEYSEMSRSEIDSLGMNGQTWLLENRHYDTLASDLNRALEKL